MPLFKKQSKNFEHYKKMIPLELIRGGEIMAPLRFCAG